MMDESRAEDLLKKYREGTLTAEEMALLESWYLNMAKPGKDVLNTDNLEHNLDMVWESLSANIQPAKQKQGRVKPLLRWISVAASIAILCTIGIKLFNKKTVEPAAGKITAVMDALPGDNRAMLTLANGKSIMLHEVGNGRLAHEGQTDIIKTKQGEIIYQSEFVANLPPMLATYNSISTPKAGQYQIKLPDGTWVWLNAASSIRFPTVFNEEERVVEIVGEAYFEVAKVLKKTKRVPFMVKAGNQVVEVLGTRFNVNSYADEGIIKTTLLEGSIKLKLTGQEDRGVLLKPGQQARLVRGAEKKSIVHVHPFEVKQVDTKSVVAWKDGYFRFDNVGLPELMRQLSRWYDMDVVYEGAVKDYEFVGQIERDTNLAKVLQILELGDVHFRIENKKIIVTN